MWKPKAQVVWAGACVHSLIIMKLGVGLNSGTCVDPVDINPFPWGWVFVQTTFTKPHPARMWWRLGTHSSVRVWQVAASTTPRSGLGGAGLRAGMAPAVLYGALNPHWALLVSAMLRAEGLGNLPEGTCACEGLSQARPQL